MEKYRVIKRVSKVRTLDMRGVGLYSFWILGFGDVWNGFRVVLDGDLRGKMRVC